MKIIHATIFCSLTLLVLAVSSSAKDWGGIVLLRSTCEDVKRILKVTSCKAPFSTYYLKEETIVVHYAEFPCGKNGKYQPVYDSTPPNVVTSIIRYLHKPVLFSNLGVDERRYKKLHTDFIGEIQYYSRDEGVTYHTVDGMLNSISYYPSKDESRKRCRN